MNTVKSLAAAALLTAGFAGSANAMMASTKYCLDTKYEVNGPATAMQMCAVPPDELTEASSYLAGRVQQDKQHGIVLGELPPASSYAERAAGFEAAQAEVFRRAEIRSHHPQPPETTITQSLKPPISPFPPKQLQPSDKIAEAHQL